MMADDETLLETIAVTAELLGTELSRGALLAMESELSRYHEDAARFALIRCRRELTGRLTLAAVIERLEEVDGRPAPDEAWGMAMAAEDEAQTVVWTEEMAEAFACARSLLEINDKVGARMAFRQTYERLTREARINGSPVNWEVSLGWDRELRTEAIEDAVRHRRLTQEQGIRYLPEPAEGGPIAQALLTGNVVEHPAIEQARLAEVRRAIQEGHARKKQEKAEKRRRQAERQAKFEESRQAALDFVDSKINENSQPDEKAG